MKEQAPRPSRAPLWIALGCVGLILLSGCGFFALLFLGVLAASVDEPGTGGAPAPVVASDADATLGYTLPAGWKQDGPWWIKELVDPTGPITTAQVRLAPAVPAQGNMGDALRACWPTAVPQELAERASGMVYRRYLGDGLLAQFVVGKGRETGRKADSLFTLYLIDCGAVWQPLIVAQTYADPSTNMESIVSMSGGLSFGDSAAMAEEFLATLRCLAGKGRPLVTPEALVGHYYYGSASSLQWQNVHTGATTMTAVSYGGQLDLRADGTYDSKFSSASGQVGNLQFAKEDETGRWRVEGDLLVLVSDQRGREERRRIAGLTQFQDGVKAAILLSNLGVVANATTVTDPADIYSTKK